MEIITSIVGKIVELTIQPVGRHLSYLCFITTNIQKLKSSIEMLKETRETVERMVYDARRNAEDIKRSVLNWLVKVDEIIERSEEILTNEAQQLRLCLNLVQRHQVSRKAVKKANEVLEMKNEGNFDRVSYSVAKYEINLLTKASNFLHFESRRSAKERIMDALMADNVYQIGIYGMGGVGKTMLVKEISREVMEKGLFDEVVTSTISQTPDLKIIQKELAEKLGLKLDEDTIEGRALKLHKRLMTEKRSLIVFDDIWASIDLEMIGIPSDVDHKGCKILFTSRDKHTLSNDMCIDKIFEIKVLQDDEAWSLFKKIVGETVETLDFKPVAVQIVRECGNLPIAIIVVAKALRNKIISVWIDALNQLKNLECMNIRGMNDKVYASLKLSYEQLEHEAKMLFLLCSMFPEDFEIDMNLLHIYATTFDFLHGVDNVAKRRHRISKLVDDLISSSLLQNCEDDEDYVKMHDLVRDVAISISSKDDQIRTLSCVTNWNKREEDEVGGNQTAVYVDFESCQNSPQKLMFPKVKLLILAGRWYFTQELSINFFEEMKELKVLQLKWMKILLLPSSLHSFANITSLHLIDSELENIDLLGQLNKLEILSFEGSNITEIPMAISQLTQLKVLNLSDCNKLEVIPPNVLSKLTKLEELNLITYNGWEVEDVNKERKNASISELMNLRALSTLCLRIEDENVMPRQMFSMVFKLEKFEISIGSPQKFTHSRQENIKKELYLKLESEYYINDGMKMLLKTSEKLHLEGSLGANILLIGLDENESSSVKHLYLINICGLQHITHSQKQPFRKVLSNLVHLCVKGLENLVSVIHGFDGKYAFNKLKFVKVKECNKLSGFFVNCSMDDLSNIEKIKINKCEMAEGIVVMENEETIKKIEFTHLKSLQLRCLPQLKNFLLQIEKGGTSTFSHNDSFFNEKVSFPNLEELKIKKVDNLKTICGNILFPNSFSKLREVSIDSCKNLEKVFNWRIMSILTCLNSISIKNCSLVEEIFEAQESSGIKEAASFLPQLKTLELYNLSSLRYVWSDDPRELVAFKSMEALIIHRCQNLRMECVSNVLPQLKYLETDLNTMEGIFQKKRSMETSSQLHQLNTSKVESLESQDGPERFCKLNQLTIHDSLDHQKTHFSMEILHLFPCLVSFEVTNTLIEEILFPNERLIFEHLRYLSLHKLPKLKHLLKEGSQNNTSLVLVQQLIYLRITECGTLNMLVPPSVSFRNLKVLWAEKCNRLTHLLNPTVAKTLEQLEHLSIHECKRMNTIIDHVGLGNEEIVFNKLNTLLLDALPNLTTFHSGKCVIRFPCLNQIRIFNCPEMNIFSLGNVSTPQLHPKSIHIVDDGKRLGQQNLKGMIVEDINTIIQQIWDQENFDSSIKYLFEQKNLEENQSHHSSSQVEEQ